MQKSIFVSFIMLCYRKLKVFYHNSKTCSFIEAVSKFFQQAAKGSGIISFFNRSMKQQKLWTNSAIYKVVYLPFNIIRKISGNGKGVLSAWVGESRIVTTLANCLNNLSVFNTRTAGWVFLAFAFTQIVLAIGMKTGDTYYLLWRMLLAVFALLLILINRTLKSLYEGSSILKWFISLLKD